MQVNQHYLLNILELLEGTRIDGKSLDSRNIEIFSSLLSLLPELILNLHVTTTKRRRTSAPCTLRSGSIRRFLDGLIDHVVAIGW